ncbi:MAG: adenylate/guanylate cyclase domain-containing protein [Acidimicrobiia bacterium]
MPETHYAKSGGYSIAYQVIGTGPYDLVYIPGWVSNVEVMWEDPGLASFLRRLASFSRLIVFDKRGTGLSDPLPLDQLPDLEARMDDLAAVMDAVGSERATLFGHSEGGNLCMLFSATHPDRTTGIALTGSFAKRIRSDDYPWAPTQEERAEYIGLVEENWGRLDETDRLAPSRSDDEAFRAWLLHYQRLSASPRAAAAILEMNSNLDMRPLLETISVPTLLLYRKDDRDVQVEEGRYIAARIPGAKLVELEGADHHFWAGDSESLLQEIEEFVTGSRGHQDHERQLATVLFTDIVGSTERAATLGDRSWRDLLERHNQIVRTELVRWRGREVGTAGDGFLATFDGPARALRCARAIAEAIPALGIEVRCGVHTGEVEIVGDDVAGLTVHIGSRIAGRARPSEVLLSRTVKDLVAGAGFAFEDRGRHPLKGVPDEWQVYALV